LAFKFEDLFDEILFGVVFLKMALFVNDISRR